MILAIIPARGGSKGVPGKNIKPLAGHPLLAYSVIAAQLSNRIDRVIISTDSVEIADIGKRYGAEVPFLRPAEFAADSSPDRGFVVHALEWFKQNERMMPDYLVHLRPTTPLRDPAILDRSIDELVADSESTSLRSAHESPESPFKWFMINEKGFYDPFGNKNYADMPRQQVPKVYIPNGYVDVLRSDYVMFSNDIHGPNIKSFISPTSIEVDTNEDFDYLEYLINKVGSPLLKQLNEY